MHEYDVMIGVPCSGLPHKSDIPCTREDEVMAFAAGVSLAGKEPKVFMQASGFAIALDVHMSLLAPYKINIGYVTVQNPNSPEHHLYMATLFEPLCKLIGKVDETVRSYLKDNAIRN